ncbi:MAG TPA: AarF/UbiB family protein [Myxococcota bacterium]|nr:AarF/UbiB family protein [Myxococcota bacterium]
MRKIYSFPVLASLLGLAFPSFVVLGALSNEETKEIRAFFADVIDPYPILEGSKENPERVAFNKHLKAIKIIALRPNVLLPALDLSEQGAESLVSELQKYLTKMGLHGPLAGQITALTEEILKEDKRNVPLIDKLIDSPRTDGIVKSIIAKVPDSEFDNLNQAINKAANDFKFDKVGLEKLDLIKVDPGMGKIALFINEILRTYHAQQTLPDRRLIIATFLRSTMPNDPPEKKLLAITKASGPFFQKILQLVGDFVNDATPDGKKLKDVLNEVKKNLLPIDPYHLSLLIKEVEAAAKNQFKITIDKTLGVASVGHALLATVTHNDGRQEKIVLKFIKPGVKERAYRDIDIIKPIAVRLGVLTFFQGTIDDILGELDFTNELKNLSFADKVYNSSDPNDRVGAVKPVANFPEDPKWIAMTLAPGRTYADFNKDIANSNEEKLDFMINYLVRGMALEELTNKWIKKAFLDRREGFYHADLHAGNVMIDINTEEIKKYLRNKFSNLSYQNITKEMIQGVPKNTYKLTLIDFGNVGYLNPSQRLHVLNFFISTLWDIHSWDGFYEAYTNLISTKVPRDIEPELKDGIKALFDSTYEQNELLGKIITFFLEGKYPPLPPVMANFGRSQIMLSNIFSGIQKDVARLSLPQANFNFGNSIIEELKRELISGTFIVLNRVDALGNKLYLNLGNLMGVARYGAKFGINWINEKLGFSKVDVNGACQTTMECKDWTLPGIAGIACCLGICQPKRKDRAGVYYCPHECVGDVIKGAGSCN